MRKFICSIIILIHIKSQAQPYLFNYSEAVSKSLFFYECQRSGKLPANKRVSWREDSGLDDGKDNGVDLIGGWYDAGDHMKFGFPMAATATKLAWSALESQSAYESIGQWIYLLDQLRWVNDYFLKCHVKNINGTTLKFYGQVGIGKIDHQYWGPAEKMSMNRPSFYVDSIYPGTELTAETAAAMAAASMVFKKMDRDYSDRLLKEAKSLFEFSEKHRGVYSNTIKDAKNHYPSISGFNDELTYAALWLYKATNNKLFLNKAKNYYKLLPNEPNETCKAYSGADSWDNKAFSCYLLLAMSTGETLYKDDIKRYLDYWSIGYKGKRIRYSPGGEAFYSKWGSLRFSANTAFLALVYAKHFQHGFPDESNPIVKFAIGQINYILGNNPQGQSFVVGFGFNHPRYPHHRNAHGSDNRDLNQPLENKHILYGALVGGPSQPDDQYKDSRSNYTENEVACDYNAGFTGALAFLVQKQGPLAFPDFLLPN